VRATRAAVVDEESHWVYEDGADEIVLRVDAPCQLLGVGLCGTHGGCVGAEEGGCMVRSFLACIDGGGEAPRGSTPLVITPDSPKHSPPPPTHAHMHTQPRYTAEVQVIEVEPEDFEPITTLGTGTSTVTRADGKVRRLRCPSALRSLRCSSRALPSALHPL